MYIYLIINVIFTLLENIFMNFKVFLLIFDISIFIKKYPPIYLRYIRYIHKMQVPIYPSKPIFSTLVESMSCGPRTTGEKNHFQSGGGPKGRVHRWYWRGEAPSPVRHILVSWRWGLLVPDGFFPHPAPCDIDGPAGSARCPFSRLASTMFGDGERRGRREFPEDGSSSAGRSMSSDAATSLPLQGRDGGNGRAGSHDCSPRPVSNRVRRRSFSSRNRFACSCNSTICRACSSCFASISCRQTRNWSSRARFAGMLVMAVNFDGPMGCLGIAKALEIRRSPGSGCTQAIAYRL